jgi:hypothetical protein
MPIILATQEAEIRKAGGVAQGEGSEFKPQYHQKKKKQRQERGRDREREGETQRERERERERASSGFCPS